MEMFIQEAVLFLILMLGMLLTLAGIVIYKTGSIKGLKDNWLKSEGKTPVWKGIGFIVGVPLLAAALLFGFNNSSYATEIKYLTQSSIFVGIDYTKNISPQCEVGGADDHLTSNMGMTQNIVRYGNISVNAKYTHHSCTIGPDSNKGYDGYGTYLEWIF